MFAILSRGIHYWIIGIGVFVFALGGFVIFNMIRLSADEFHMLFGLSKTILMLILIPLAIITSIALVADVKAMLYRRRLSAIINSATR